MSNAWDGIADEFRHNTPTGARIIAVAGADPTRSHVVAEALAASLARRGERVERLDTSDADATRLREQVVAPFRADRSTDRVLVVSGPDRLLADDVRPLWHFTLWNSAGDEPAHPDASSLVDVTDPERAFRRYRDSCGTAECCND